MRIGFDIDGVLANFYAAYEELTIRHGGEDLFGPHKWPNEYPCCWHWPQHYGYSDALMDFNTGPVWREIKTSDSFWRRLPPLPDMEVARAFLQGHGGRQHDAYFITDRPGPTAKRQTEEWLRGQGVPDPTVLISGRKAALCDALRLDLYFDDKPEYLMEVETTVPNTLAVLIDRPYNQHVTPTHRARRITTFLPWGDKG